MVYRFCPCGKGQIIGELRSVIKNKEPEINCDVCKNNFIFKNYMKRDPWEGNYWYEWFLIGKI